MYIRYHVCSIYIWYLYISLFLSLSWTVHPSTHLLIHLHQGPNRQHATKRLPPSHNDQPVPSVWFQGERTWQGGTSTSTGHATTSGWSKFSIDQVGSLEIIGFDLLLLPSRPLSRTIYTLEDYITAGLKPEKWWWILLIQNDVLFPDFISF